MEIIAAKKCSRKTCRRVGQVLPISEFNTKCDTRDGYRYECRECQRGYNTSYRKQARKITNKPMREPEPKGWPVPAQADLSAQLLHLHVRRAYGAVPMGRSW